MAVIKPWIGMEWGKQNNHFNGIRLLLIGHSIHADKHPIGSAPENILHEAVNEYVLYAPNWRFYKIVTGLFAGLGTISPVSAEARATIWQSVAFLNFVPVVGAS